MDQKKINILFITDTLCEVGGAERHLSYLSRGLPRDVFNCHVAAFEIWPNKVVDEIRNAGIPVIHFPVGREYTPNAFMQACRLASFIKQNNIDIVQTYHQKSDTFGALTAKWAGVKHIISSKRDMGHYRRIWHVLLNRLIRNIFEKVIVVCDAVGEMIASKERVNRNRIVRIYNGVDKFAFYPPSPEERDLARQRLGILKDDFAIGMVAHFRKEKNHDIFFTGALRAAEMIPSLKIIAVGSGELFEKYKTRYKDEARIIMTGQANDTLRYLRAMDVGCLIPGMNEGFSNSILEKMAVGLPMIVSDVGGNSEAVIDGENGLLIPPNDEESFTKAIIYLYENKEARIRMGIRSRELVEKNFSLEIMLQSHESLYRSLVRAKGAL